MAIANSDGSIILSTKVDTSGINKGMSQMQGKSAGVTKTFSKLGAAIASAFAIQKIIQFSNESASLATQTEASVQRLVDIYGSASDSVANFIDQNSKALGLSKSVGASIASTYGNLLSVWADQATNAELTNALLNQTAVVASRTGRTTTDVAERIRSGLLGNTEAIEDLGINVNIKTIEITDAFKRIADGRSWEQLNAYEQAQVRTLAILEQSTNKYGTTVAGTSATIRNQFNSAYQDFQNSWGTIVNQVLLPVLQVLTEILNIATAGLNALSGRSGKILEDAQIQEESTDKTAENIEEQADNQKALNKEMKKTLAGFDDIQILSANTADNTSGGGGLDIGLQGIGGDLGGSLDGSAYVDEVDETLTAIMGIVALSLAAVGLILLFTGNIGWGVGFIIAGAATLTATMGAASEFGYDGIIQMITTIMGIAGGALLALGIILLWIGGVVGIGVAIGMIIAGGALIVSAVAAQAAFAPEDIGAWLSLIMGIAGGALLALGIILCMVGSIPIGVGMIIAGAVSLVSAVALNSDAVVEAIQGPLGVIMAIVGAALLVLGIILTCCGVLPLGIALIAAGAVSLVTVVALNWDAIVDWVKGAWEAVKAFWNKYIAPVFTIKFWLDLAKNCANGLISGFENAINGIITMFENMINFVVDGINSIGFDIPDWLGGGHFGFDIPRVSFGRVSIPRLAQGAVIPPNREFLAVLGDQKQGLNIETPLSTMIEAFNAALDARGDGSANNSTIVLEIDGREFGRAVVEQGNRESRRIGTRLVVT